MATDFDWTGFQALAKRLDDLLAGEREDDEFANDLRRALTFVYTAGITMPTAGDIYEDSGGEAFADRAVDLNLGSDPAKMEAALAELVARVAHSVEAAQPEGDVDADSLQDLAELAATGLLDVQQSLATGSAYFDDGRLGEASWEWSFQFDEWGAQALSAISALHELLWGAR